ncbi:sigma-54 dependent transcriptional regulator [Kangiella japonica]|uniref:Sigma-54 dependent transcriptional regulator n=1 Tax=Kangiella japonica TaxID=647384 RepID=A0ABN0SUZ2_9GAMM
MNQLLEPSGQARATLILNYGDVSTRLQQKLKARGWCAYIASNLKEFKKLFKQHRFEVVIIYFDKEQIPDSSELETLSTLNIITKWIAIVPSEHWLETHPSILFSHLFYDYHRQPLRYDHLLATIGHAFGMAHLQSQKLKHYKVQNNQDDLIGHSKETERLRNRILGLSKESSAVLISGECGTGKTFISRLLHKSSLASAGPFYSISCGAASEALLNSELFGHEEGSLYPNCDAKVGKIAQCHQGSLLLKDIEELPLSLQPSLAQYLEQQIFFPLGSTIATSSNCRILVSSSSDLRQLVQKNLFSEELYSALSTTTIEVPTLSERHQDIKPLAQYFLAHFCDENEQKKFTQSALEAMQQYHWPGNVRELTNRIRRAIILADDDIINERHLELPNDNHLHNLTLKDARDKVEKDIVVRTIAQAGYNHSKAAKDLGISRTSLYRLISKHEILL